jgi:hypothetical protein
MKYFGLFLFGLLPLTVSAAFGQVTTGVVGAQVQTTNGRVSAGTTFTAPRMIPAGITGAPYSAEQVQEHIQILSDGTKITQPAMRTKLYRDSLGRTRTERPLMGRLPDGQDSPLIIQITDPVAGVEYVLDQQNKIAHRTTAQPASAVARRMPATPSPATVTSATGVFTMSAAGAFTQSLPAPNGAQRESTEEKLGPQMIEGVLAEGVRRVTTIPTGAQGNDRPFSITFETWRSSDLTVLSKTSDPRSGDSITRLTNISRSEPDPSLFQPPADYQVVEETSQFMIRF